MRYTINQRSMSPSSLNNPTLENQESKDRIKGIISSIIAHALIVLLLFFFGTYSGNPPLQEEAGIPVDFGTSSVGGGDVQPETADPVTTSDPQPPTPQVTPPVQPPPTKTNDNVVTQQTEDAPVAMDDKKKPEKQPIKEEKAPVKENVAPVKPTPPVNTAPKGPEVNPNALMGKPTGRNVQGNQGTDGDTPGDKGVPWGTKGDAYSGPNGTGNIPGGHGSGTNPNGDFYLAGRKMLYKPKLVGTIQESGTVVVSITVDKKGNVIDVECCKAKGTTTSNQALINKAMEDARKIKFDPNEEAPDKQYGTATFTFKLQ